MALKKIYSVILFLVPTEEALHPFAPTWDMSKPALFLTERFMADSARLAANLGMGRFCTRVEQAGCSTSLGMGRFGTRVEQAGWSTDCNT